MIGAASTKRSEGRYYTLGNPFSLKPFLQWATNIRLSTRTILEPFAGDNSLIRGLEEVGLCERFRSYDISPASTEVAKRDSIADFPRGFSVCVTNPPWLARNSATRRGLPYAGGEFDNLYKRCLHLCLGRCDYVAALLPASFLQSGLFLDRLNYYILLHWRPFGDTESPVCLALFNPARHDSGVRIYHDDDYIGQLDELERRQEVYFPASTTPASTTRLGEVEFNDPEGRLGFVATDGVSRAGIRFCRGDEVAAKRVLPSSRHITRIGGDVPGDERSICYLNACVDKMRSSTRDALLTPFMGLRLDGRYRRRMDFGLVKRLLQHFQARWTNHHS